MGFYLGIDGGGSRFWACLADETGRPLAQTGRDVSFEDITAVLGYSLEGAIALALDLGRRP